MPWLFPCCPVAGSIAFQPTISDACLSAATMMASWWHLVQLCMRHCNMVSNVKSLQASENSTHSSMSFGFSMRLTQHVMNTLPLHLSETDMRAHDPGCMHLAHAAATCCQLRFATAILHTPQPFENPWFMAHFQRPSIITTLAAEAISRHHCTAHALQMRGCW